MRISNWLHRSARVATAALVALLTAAGVARAQGGRANDNILYPVDELPIYIGPEFGYGLWTSAASFAIPDGQRVCTSFGDGDGSGITAGVRAFIYINRWLMFTPRLRFENRGSTFLTQLPGEPARNGGNEVVTLDQEGQLDASISTITLDLRGGIDIARTGFYLSAGVAGSLVRSASYDYLERLKGPAGFSYGDTRTNEHTLATGRSFEEYNSLAFDVRGGLGYLFEVGPVMINPEVGYSVPLTSLFPDPETLKQSGIIGSLGVLYNIGE